MDTQETTIFTAVLIASIILIIIVAFFVVSIVRQQRRNLELSRQNVLAEISVLEKERARLATDLHDELGPLLSVIKFQVDTVEIQDQKDAEQLQSASTHLDSLMDRVRTISYNLMPSVLIRKGLSSSIQDFLARVEEATGLKTSYSCTAPPHLPEDISINIYRIVQEVVHNAVKHAKAKNLIIEMNKEKEDLILLIRDDGIGFNPEQASQKGSGLGLKSIKSRVDLMNGSLRLESKENKGTAFLMRIPIENQ